MGLVWQEIEGRMEENCKWSHETKRWVTKEAGAQTETEKGEETRGQTGLSCSYSFVAIKLLKVAQKLHIISRWIESE